jgi:hypothetical protein
MMDSETATFWLVASAIAQAVSAIVIVGLTIFLARTAHGALSESRAQVKASRAAVEESRRAIEEMGRQREVHERATAEMARQREEMVRQREDVRRHALLSSIPVVDVGQPHASWGAQSGLWTGVRIANATSEPALDVRVQLFASEEDADELRHAHGSALLPMLTPGDEKDIAIDSHELVNVTLSEKGMEDFWSRSETPPHYGPRQIFVAVQVRSILGSTVVQQYRWFANAKDQRPDHVWVPRVVLIRAEPEADPIHVRLGD